MRNSRNHRTVKTIFALRANRPVYFMDTSHAAFKIIEWQTNSWQRNIKSWNYLLQKLKVCQPIEIWSFMPCVRRKVKCVVFSTRLSTCVVGMNAIIDVSHCMCGSDQYTFTSEQSTHDWAFFPFWMILMNDTNKFQWYFQIIQTWLLKEPCYY